MTGKDHTNENFPVASRLIAARHRPVVMAFYRFARAADDIADHPSDSAADRLAHLDAMTRGLDGDGTMVAVELRAALAERALSDTHARDLLVAFRRDVTQDRYADWDDLIDYCRWSAMPVGRFMLDVHGEARALWPASDALCAALQIINHLQDCREDYAALGRVYVPLDALSAVGLGPDALGDPIPPSALTAVVRGLAVRVEPLLAASAGFGAAIRSTGLAYEVAVIHRLAVDLVERLRSDPFAPSRHHNKIQALSLAGAAVGAMALRRFGLWAGPSKLRSDDL